MRQILGALLLISSATHAQYCITGGPTTTADSNIESLTLTGASGSINYTGCPAVSGVQEYFTETAFLDAGASYTVSVQFGTCDGNYAGAGEAWIDFNQNEIFEASESIGTWSGTPPTTISDFNFTVPGSVTTGATRMRVIQQEGGSLPLDPCASFTWGSVTDFSLLLQNGVDCSTFVGDDASNPRLVSSIPFNQTHDNSICYTSQNPAYNSPDVFYLLTPVPQMNSIKVSLCGSSFDTFLSIQDKNGTVIAYNDDSGSCGSGSEIDVNLNDYDSVYVIVEGWNNESGPFEINISQGTVGQDELTQNLIKIHPNPAKEYITIDQYTGPLSIAGIDGKIVKQLTYESNTKMMVNDLPPGVYVIHIMNSDQGQFKQKLIIQ